MRLALDPATTAELLRLVYPVTGPSRADVQGRHPTTTSRNHTMLIHRFNPTDHFGTMDMLFDAIMPAGRRATRFGHKPARVSVEHNEDGFVLEAELPGVAPEQLQLSVGGDWVEISTARELELPEGYTAIRRERANYKFERRLKLPARIDGEGVEAKLRDGVLTVSLPKHASVQPRQVAIKAA